MSHVLLLGANSDIAKALAHEYASHGGHLILAARQPERLQAFVQDLQIRYPVEVQTVAFDALDFASHPGFYEALEPKPEIAICVFGYQGNPALAQRDFSETNLIIQSNYTGAVSILNVIANDFEKRRSGLIIGISSVAADRGRRKNYIYGSAKAGFTTYLSGLRSRLSVVGVHVMTVHPGYVQTRMLQGQKAPAPLVGQPKQVALDIYQAAQRRVNLLYTVWFWRYIMLVVRWIPETLFKKMNF